MSPSCVQHVGSTRPRLALFGQQQLQPQAHSSAVCLWSTPILLTAVVAHLLNTSTMMTAVVVNLLSTHPQC